LPLFFAFKQAAGLDHALLTLLPLWIPDYKGKTSFISWSYLCYAAEGQIYRTDFKAYARFILRDGKGDYISRPEIN
jgi:hypothetical protein